MLKLFLTISFLFIILPAYNLFSEEINNKIKGPIIVTSDTLTNDNKSRTALFEKNVIAKTSDITLYADKMLQTS
jgi:lipopolysaccharide export system protein LptA